MDIKPLRRIRSFALRTGRMTEGQQRAYQENWQRFGLTIDQGIVDQNAVFGRSAPLVVEVGFGMGQSLVEMAKAEPDKDFIGIEVHTPGVAKLMMMAAELDLPNLKVFEFDAIDVFEKCISEASIDRFQLYFPDPWHKKRHHKRRIVKPEFMDLLAKHVKPGGMVHFATDWENYAEHMMEVVTHSEDFENIAGEEKFSERPDWRPYTKFERRGERLGHGVWDILLKRR